jgi:hypothetical protein
MTAAIDSPKEEKKTDAAEDSLADEIPVATVLDVEAAGGKNVEENVKEIEGTNGTEVLPNKGKMHAFLSTFGFMAEREGHNAPQLPLYEIFAIFFWFGCRAFGGPVAQIAMMKQEIVVEKKWISTELFNRVYAVYQVLPGPEATELACYFGFLSGGRLGAIMGGIRLCDPRSVAPLLLVVYLRHLRNGQSDCSSFLSCITSHRGCPHFQRRSQAI